MFVRILVVFIFLMFPVCNVQADENVFQVGVSYVERIPSNFFGTWRVKSTLTDTNSPSNFKQKNLDIWNISKNGNVINIKNPFSGAEATVTLNYANENSINFTKISNYEGKRLTDTVKITIDGDSFSGENIILLETLSNVDNSVIKTATGKYRLNGEKIAQ